MKKLLIILSLMLMFCGVVCAKTQPMISGGNSYNVLNTGNEIIAWGRNDCGQCDVPKNVKFKSISAGYSHAVGLDESGNFYAWGSMTSVPEGKFKLAAAGENITAAVTEDNVLVVLTDTEERFDMGSAAVSLAAGDRFVTVLDENGTVSVFGNDAYGIGEAENVTDICMISAGARHLLVLKSDGSVLAFGDNEYGQCNVPQTKAASISAGGFHSIILTKDKTLVAFGDNSYGQCDMPQEYAEFVEAGYEHTTILTVSGKLITVGNNRYGVCMNNMGTLKQISTGFDSTAFLDTDGKLTLVGSNAAGKSDIPEDIGKVIKTAVGGNHTMALCADGTVRVWGSNIYGQCNIPTYLTNVTDIAAGFNACLAVQDGKVYGWGYNIYGQCSPPYIDGKVVAIEAGAHHAVALTENGDVYVWGNDDTDQSAVPENMGKVTQIASGDYYVLALNSDGELFGWGYGADGQLDFPSTTGVKNIYAGAFVSVVEYENGETYFCGTAELLPENKVNYKMLSLGHANITAEDTDGNIVSYGAEKYIIPQSLKNIGSIYVDSSYGEMPIITADNEIRVQFENYDILGAGVSYYDTTEGNGYGHYRQDDVEIPTTGKTDSPYCVSMAETEWLNFTIEAESDMMRTLWINSAATSDARVSVYVNDLAATDNTYLFKTGGSAVFDDWYICEVQLKKGLNAVKIKNSAGSFAADYLTLKPLSEEPYTHLTIPGTIMPYQYNTGGLNVSYGSPLRVKNGLGSNKIRTSDYISMTTVGSLIVSSFQPEDWLEYTVDVTKPGKYGIYVTTQGNGNANQKGEVSLSVDGTTVINGADLGATTALTEKYVGSIVLENPSAKLRVSNNGKYGWLLGNIRIVCEEEYDKNGVSLILNGTVHTAEAYYANKSDKDETMYLIIAGYDSAKLKYISVKKITAKANTFEKYTAEIEMSGISEAKAFLWEDFPGCRVLIENKR